jgi:hypothetical protein
MLDDVEGLSEAFQFICIMGANSDMVFIASVSVAVMGCAFPAPVADGVFAVVTVMVIGTDMTAWDTRRWLAAHWTVGKL